MPQASVANRPKSLLKPTSCTGAPIKAAPGLTCEAAYEALRAYAPNLPELTTVFITHSHWDHVGGHAYFRALNPRLRFYARSNCAEEIARELGAPGVFDKQFVGEAFSLDNVRSFKPDITIDRRTELKIGGTRIELIPVQGGETHDAMFINLPDEGVLFVGDFIMPYLGAPFVEEGDLQGLLDAIDIVVEKNPQYLLHGHEPLTRNFTSASMLLMEKHQNTDPFKFIIYSGKIREQTPQMTATK